MVKVRLFIIVILSFVGTINAQDINFQAPTAVASNQVFQIEYFINSSQVSEITISEKPDEIEILNKSNPKQASSSSFSNVNGKQVRSVESSLTFKCKSKIENGFISVPILRAKVNGKFTSSKELKIQVVPASYTKDREDFNVAIVLSAETVYEGESITAELKLYYAKDVAKVDRTNIPPIKGTTINRIDLNGIKSSQGIYNNKLYDCALIDKYEIILDSSGTYTIPSVKVIAITQKLKNGSGIFKQYTNIENKLFTTPISIQVLPIKSKKTKNYLGVFSELEINSTTPKTKINSDQALQLNLELKGVGNFNTLNPPILEELKKSFQIYDPEEKSEIEVLLQGQKGVKSYTYTLVPKTTGVVKTEDIYLYYFNSSRASYDSLLIPHFEVTIVDVTSEIEEPIITDLITDFSTSVLEDSKDTSLPLFGSLRSYFIGLIFIIGVFIASIFSFKLRLKSINNRLATPNLSRREHFDLNIRKLETSPLYDQFPKELIKTLEDFLLDKFNMERAEFSKNDLNKVLSPETLRKTKSILTQLEASEYAGISHSRYNSEEVRNKFINEAKELISEIENT